MNENGKLASVLAGGLWQVDVELLALVRAVRVLWRVRKVTLGVPSSLQRYEEGKREACLIHLQSR